ncbi:MAG: hypothetical protein AB7G15_13015 [Alphaproteobacteria bacterium]
MRRRLAGMLICLLIAVIGPATTVPAGMPFQPLGQACIGDVASVSLAKHAEADRTQRVLDRFTAPPVQLAACNNACRQSCARGYAACIGSGGRPGACAGQRSRCLASCGC